MGPDYGPRVTNYHSELQVPSTLIIRNMDSSYRCTSRMDALFVFTVAMFIAAPFAAPYPTLVGEYPFQEFMGFTGSHPFQELTGRSSSFSGSIAYAAKYFAFVVLRQFEKNGLVVSIQSPSRTYASAAYFSRMRCGYRRSSHLCVLKI